MSGRFCKCGCGLNIKASKRYVDKEHQLRHMKSGEAHRLNSLQTSEAKRRGGESAGRAAVESGHLAAASKKGAARASEIAELLRTRPGA